MSKEISTPAEKQRSVKLTDHEVLLLVPIERPEIQDAVRRARDRLQAVAKYSHLTPARASFIADVVNEGRESGRLLKQDKSIRHCAVCGRSGEERLPSKRHRKLRYYPLSGVELAYRFVTMKGYANLGCCRECFAAVEADLVVALVGVQCEISEGWSDANHDWKRYDRKQCTECGWEGHEGEMRMLRAVFGGRFPGGCPECDAENSAFGLTKIKTGDGFVVVPMPPPKNLPNLVQT